MPQQKQQPATVVEKVVAEEPAPKVEVPVEQPPEAEELDLPEEAEEEQQNEAVPAGES